jgi:hypothetical protein
MPVFNRCLAVVLAGIALLAGSPARAADDSRYRIPTAEFRERVKRVGILPVFLASGIADRVELKPRMEEVLAERLRAAGLEVVGSTAYTAAFDTMNRQVGGIYSAADGSADPEKLKLVRTHARNAFFEAEGLDAVVVSAITYRVARFQDWTMEWDGVTEPSTGLPVGGFTKFNSSGNSVSGRVPALSFGVQIEDQDERQLYLAWGGIQPTAYREAPKGVLWVKKESTNGLVDVPPGDLLRDEARLRRAVEIAARPLLPGQDAGTVAVPATADGLPPLPAGRLPEPENPFRVPRDEILARVKTVAILPLGLGNLDPSQTIGFRYDTLLATEAEKLGWRVASAKVMADKRRELAAAGGFHDVYTGELDAAAAAAFRRAVMTAGEPVDAVLWPSIVERTADTDGTNAYWDGAGQHLFNLGPAKRKFWPGQRLGGGVVQALSLDVDLRAPDDTPLYEARGGIQILERPGDGGKEALTSLELFRDPARDEEAVRLALGPLAVPPATAAK